MHQQFLLSVLSRGSKFYFYCYHFSCLPELSVLLWVMMGVRDLPELSVLLWVMMGVRDLPELSVVGDDGC